MPPIPLYYTFGNHMHWVDMEWLWGYFVMPSSVRDMIHFCNETGARGNVNFDGIGYEKLAVEAPDALQELREAVQSGMIEVVGASYGQPYGLFHGGESNVRQRVYGVRSVMRLLGVRPKTFWEEEFDFFPQLPQMLRGVGFEYASLFFQWTWHTPEVPKEDVPVVWWEGQDGSRLLTATRNRLNLHQWPEDMDILLAELAESDQSKIQNPKSQIPMILQWLELMPSPDWMCRSELLLPKLKQILADERFEIRHATLGEYLASVECSVLSVEGESLDTQHLTLNTPVPVRPYTMDDVWHGMSLGKNGDNMRIRSFDVESLLLSAETLSATAGLFGRPYAQWDVYPTWELEEAWRELLQAQHHDNDECEGLCGYVGVYSYDRADSLARGALDRTLSELAERLQGPGDSEMVYNPLGWPRKWHVVHREQAMTVVDVPAFGCTVVPPDAPDVDCGQWRVGGRVATFERGLVRVVVDLDRATVIEMANTAHPDGIRLDGKPLWEWVGISAEGNPLRVKGHERSFDDKHEAPLLVGDRWLRLPVEFEGFPDDGFTLAFGVEPHTEALELSVEGKVPHLKGGLNDAFSMVFHVPSEMQHLRADQPYGVSQIHPSGNYLKKYPSGDWMTSPQWFEEVHRPFSATSFVDFTDGQHSGLLITHKGCSQWFAAEAGAYRLILNAYDPWDEKRYVSYIDRSIFIEPHLELSGGDCWRRAQEYLRPCEEEYKEQGDGDLPAAFSAASSEAQNICLTAFYRETEEAGRRLDAYAGRGMEYPYVLRLAEFDGVETETLVRVAGTVERAYKTNLMGEIESEIAIQRGDRESFLPIAMRPHEIATVYLDIVEGRKQTRDLDAKRKIWATVHRVEE
jgi:alpha-mannosidase